MHSSFVLPPSKFDELKKVFGILSSLPKIKMTKGIISHQFGDSALISLDVTSLVGNIDLSITNIPSEMKELKILDPGNNHVKVQESDNVYTFSSGMVSVSLSKCPIELYNYEPMGLAHRGDSEVIFQCAVTSRNSIKNYYSVVYKKGPIEFVIDESSKLIEVINANGSKFRPDASPMAPPSLATTSAKSAMSLFSYYLSELSAQDVIIEVSKEKVVDGMSSVPMFRLSAKFTIASGLSLEFEENLLPRLYAL